ncbi:MAG: fenitrothion hydrolase [Solirubrobacteraceae bacterium]
MGALLIAPAGALAHGLVGKTDLPIPRWLFAWAAAVVLVVSFVALATLWPKPRLAQIRERGLTRVPRLLEPLCGLIGIGLFCVVVYAGFAGKQEATANLAPTWIYVIFWVGLAFASFLFGDVFRAFNPWRALARAVASVLPVKSEAMVYPVWLGRWPAALGIFGFAWLELVYTNKDAPETLAVLALAYAAVQLVGMVIYGIEVWSDRADAFSVYFGLLARLSPLRWSGGELSLRPPFVGIADLEILPGTVALLAVMIGSTSFDGFSVGSVWVGSGQLFSDLQGVFTGAGVSIQTADEIASTVGLLAMIGVVAGLYRLGIAGMHSIRGAHTTQELAGRFAHSLVPIAAAYVAAHYFSLLAYQGQALGYLASDPLGTGSDLFGTASSSIDYNLVASNVIWYVQVAALVIGHAAGLTLAHERALLTYTRASEATRSQYWMLAVMVAFTSLGLWILSSTQ